LVTVLQGVESIELETGILAVTNGVVATVHTILALAVTETFDIGGVVQSEFDFLHLLDELRLYPAIST
jgi:hypothetical protein